MFAAHGMKAGAADVKYGGRGMDLTTSPGFGLLPQQCIKDYLTGPSYRFAHLGLSWQQSSNLVLEGLSGWVYAAAAGSQQAVALRGDPFQTLRAGSNMPRCLMPTSWLDVQHSYACFAQLLNWFGWWSNLARCSAASGLSGFVKSARHPDITISCK